MHLVKISQRNGLNFQLDKSNLTAQTIQSRGVHDDVHIPRSLINDSLEYIVKKIGPNTFKHNERIATVQFPEDSELEIIDDNSFNNCSINNISIPVKVKYIGEFAFSLCYNLKSIDIPEHSDLQTIGPKAFSSSPIETFSIPSKLKDLRSGWCCNTRKLNSISISPTNVNYIFLDKEKKIVGCKIDKTSTFYDDLIFA